MKGEVPEIYIHMNDTRSASEACKEGKEKQCEEASRMMTMQELKYISRSEDAGIKPNETERGRTRTKRKEKQ
jgi:hypothetical protein